MKDDVVITDMPGDYSFLESLTSPCGSGHAIVDIDLDGVCADYISAFRAVCAKKYKVPEESIPEPDTYDLASAKGWPLKDGAEFMELHTAAVRDHLYKHLPIFPGTREALWFLDDNNFHIRIVTHRLISSGLHEIVVADTAAWLEAHQLPYMSLCFVGLKDTLNANLHIEDSPDTVRRLANAEQQVVLMDRSYNREIRNVPRFRSWDDLTEVIECYLKLNPR